jgi:uncharacterized protein (DUF2267 family)
LPDRLAIAIVLVKQSTERIVRMICNKIFSTTQTSVFAVPAQQQGPEQQKMPRLGSEVRFGDGITAGRVRALHQNHFVVIRGKKRVRRLTFPYSSIVSIGNRVVTLRSTKAETLDKVAPVPLQEKESVSKKRFIRDIDEHLELDNAERAERIARITLYLLSKRLTPDRKKQLKKNLPAGIRSLWAMVEQPGTDSYFNMADFLVPIRKQGRLSSMEEAFIASREVFAALRRIMPPVEAMEISRALPRGLQEIWESAATGNSVS